ncbi:hypothetical protein HYDPIDRAFT_165023 [Hydnomerulius pinastri MD-312]|nr:hypothetical protein HYDPIDRAFT_165023 [Hydnomerulius pinastri MD-312]
MHRVFRFPELLQIILSHLDDGSTTARHSPPFTTTLARLARTCRSFGGPALDMLYEEVDLFHLLQCLPRYLRVWEIEDMTLYTRSNWTVFGNIPVVFGGTVGRRHLFPNLRDLRWSEDAPELLPFARIFFGPVMTSLSLELGDMEIGEAECSILIFLASLCPDLQDVKVDGSDPMLTNAVYVSVATWGNLRSFSSTVEANTEALITLASYGEMQTLDVRVDAEELSKDIETYIRSATKPLPPFPMLRDLKVTSDVLSAVSSLLGATQSLSTLQVQLGNGSSTHPASDYTELFKALSARSHGTVKSIQIHEDDNPRISRSSSFTAETFSPVFVFTSLSALTIETHSSFALTDQDLSGLAKAWPNLHTLQLNKRLGWRHPSKITFSGLIALLACCPKLRKLAISIDATKLDTITTKRPGGGVSNALVTELFLGNSRIADGQEVAVVLSDILPNLNNITAWQCMDMYGHAGWRDQLTIWQGVMGLHRTLTKVRKQERNWKEG